MPKGAQPLRLTSTVCGGPTSPSTPGCWFTRLGAMRWVGRHGEGVRVPGSGATQWAGQSREEGMAGSWGKRDWVPSEVGEKGRVSCPVLAPCFPPVSWGRALRHPSILPGAASQAELLLSACWPQGCPSASSHLLLFPPLLRRVGGCLPLLISPAAAASWVSVLASPPLASPICRAPLLCPFLISHPPLAPCAASQFSTPGFLTNHLVGPPQSSPSPHPVPGKLASLCALPSITVPFSVPTSRPTPSPDMGPGLTQPSLLEALAGPERGPRACRLLWGATTAGTKLAQSLSSCWVLPSLLPAWSNGPEQLWSQRVGLRCWEDEHVCEESHWHRLPSPQPKPPCAPTWKTVCLE